MRWWLNKVRLNRGGYDASGSYYGVGDSLYRAGGSEPGGWSTEEFRAPNREAAKRYVIEHFDPTATFWN